MKSKIKCNPFNPKTIEREKTYPIFCIRSIRIWGLNGYKPGQGGN